jgi:hypothetical protein
MEEEIIKLEVTKKEAEKIIKALESQNDDLIEKVKKEISAEELLVED